MSTIIYRDPSIPGTDGYQYHQPSPPQGQRLAGTQDDTNPNTLHQLKSFIKDKLTHAESFNSNGSSEGSLENDGPWSGATIEHSRDRSLQTPEPQPLTRSNVTVHDTLWRKDSEEYPAADYQEYRLTPPLNSLAKDINEKMNSQRWAELMQASDKAYESDHSSSQDTMIIKTEVENNVPQGAEIGPHVGLPFTSYAQTSSNSSGNPGSMTLPSTSPQSATERLKPSIKRRPSLGQIRRQNAMTKLELSSGPLSPIRSPNNDMQFVQGAHPREERGAENSDSYPPQQQQQQQQQQYDVYSRVSYPQGHTESNAFEGSSTGIGLQRTSTPSDPCNFSYEDLHRNMGGVGQHDYIQGDITTNQDTKNIQSTSELMSRPNVQQDQRRYDNNFDGATAKQFDVSIRNNVQMVPLKVSTQHLPAQNGPHNGRRNTEDDKDDGYDSPDALSSDAGSSSSTNSASPTDRSTTTTTRGGQSIQTLELDSIQQSAPAPPKTKTVTFGGVETRLYDVEPPSPRPRLLLRAPKVPLGTMVPRQKPETPSDFKKTNFGYVDRGKIPSFRGMNAALRRQAFQQTPQNQTGESLEDKLKQLAVHDDATAAETTPADTNNTNTERYSDHSVYSYHGNTHNKDQRPGAQAVSMRQIPDNNITQPITQQHGLNSSRVSHVSRPDDNWHRQQPHEANQSSVPYTDAASRHGLSTPYGSVIQGASGAKTTPMNSSPAEATDRNQPYARQAQLEQLEAQHLGTQSGYSTQAPGMYPNHNTAQDRLYDRAARVADRTDRPIGTHLSGVAPLPKQNNNTSPVHLSSSSQRSSPSPTRNRDPTVYTDERYRGQSDQTTSRTYAPNTSGYQGAVSVTSDYQGQRGMIPLSDELLQSGPTPFNNNSVSMPSSVEPPSPTRRMLQAGDINERGNYFQVSASPKHGMVKSSSDYDYLASASASAALSQPVAHPTIPSRSMSQSVPSLVTQNYDDRVYVRESRRSLAHADYVAQTTNTRSPDRSPTHHSPVKTTASSPNSGLPRPSRTNLYYSPMVSPETANTNITRTIVNDLAVNQNVQPSLETEHRTQAVPAQQTQSQGYISKDQTQSVMSRLNELRQSHARLKRPSAPRTSPPKETQSTVDDSPHNQSPYAHLLRHKPVQHDVPGSSPGTHTNRPLSDIDVAGGRSSTSVYRQHSMDRRRPTSEQMPMDWREGAHPPQRPTSVALDYPSSKRSPQRGAGVWYDDTNDTSFPQSPVSPSPSSQMTFIPGDHRLHSSPPSQRSSTASYDRMSLASQEPPKKNIIYTTAADLYRLLDS